MGTFSTVAPTNIVGWSAEVSGDWVNMYNKGKYGYAYQSKCAVTRLSDNSICVRIKMYSNAIMGWGADKQSNIYSMGERWNKKRIRAEWKVQLWQWRVFSGNVLLHASVVVYWHDGYSWDDLRS